MDIVNICALLKVQKSGKGHPKLLATKKTRERSGRELAIHQRNLDFYNILLFNIHLSIPHYPFMRDGLAPKPHNLHDAQAQHAEL